MRAHPFGFFFFSATCLVVAILPTCSSSRLPFGFSVRSEPFSSSDSGTVATVEGLEVQKKKEDHRKTM